MTRTRKKILVVDGHRKSVLPVIESMAKGGFYVIVASSKRINCSFFSRYCCERMIHPCTISNKQAFQEWLLRLLKKQAIDMVFPASYASLAISEIQDEVCQYSHLLGPDHSTFMKGWKKIPTMKAALETGVPIPETWFPHEIDGGIEEVSGNIENWPVLIKPSDSSGARGIVRCCNKNELKINFVKTEAEFGECYIQDFVPPGKYQYKVDMLVDRNQRLIAGVVYGKTRWYPPDGGSSVLNFSVDRPDILQLAYRILVQMKWVGFCDFDFIDDPRDNTPKLIEINPRFPESFRMVTSVGLDFPMMMYHMAHEKQLEPIESYPINKFLRFLPGDILWFLSVNNKKRFTTWPKWFDFFNKDTTYQLCKLNDPGLLIGYLLENFLMITNSTFWSERFRRTAKTEKPTS